MDRSTAGASARLGEVLASVFRRRRWDGGRQGRRDVPASPGGTWDARAESQVTCPRRSGAPSSYVSVDDGRRRAKRFRERRSFTRAQGPCARSRGGTHGASPAGSPWVDQRLPSRVRPQLLPPAVKASPPLPPRAAARRKGGTSRLRRDAGLMTTGHPTAQCRFHEGLRPNDLRYASSRRVIRASDGTGQAPGRLTYVAWID